MVGLAIAQLRGAAAKARMWARKNPWPAFLLAVGLGTFVWVLVATIRLDNMGFRGQSFWDWMDLLLVPLALAVAGLWFSRVQKQTEQEVALDRQRQDILDAYLDKMTELLLEKGLGSDAAPEVKRLARTRTIIALMSLDQRRNRQVVQFLRESRLVSRDPVISLEGADLTEVLLDTVNLSGINLSRAQLFRASLGGAHLSRSRLRGAGLSEATLVVATLKQADLSEANLRAANLSMATLVGANLGGANLYGTILSGAYLIRVNLGGADLRKANLSGADLREAFLEKANVSTEQLLQAKTLEGATMPDGTKYEEWIKLQETGNGEGKETG